MLSKINRQFEKIYRQPLRYKKRRRAYQAGFEFGMRWQNSPSERLDENHRSEMPRNPLRDYFEQHNSGPGIYKWLHYFQLYHRHFAGFVDREVHIAEVGVYSGGSLGMWRQYFGAKCHVYDIDIEPACKAYETDGVRIFIGDQADRSFWQEFRRQVPNVDILIDDGGHAPLQQIVTLEEMLPHLRQGGVYVCEDIHDQKNIFAGYLAGLSRNMNAWKRHPGVYASTPTNFQNSVQGIHLYPYLTVIEKLTSPVNHFACVLHGSEWQPFL